MRKLLILPMLALLLAFSCQHQEANEPLTVEDWLADAAAGGMSDSLLQDLEEVLSNDGLREADPKAWQSEIAKVYVAASHEYQLQGLKAMIDTASDLAVKRDAQAKYDSVRQVVAERSRQ